MLICSTTIYILSALPRMQFLLRRTCLLFLISFLCRLLSFFRSRLLLLSFFFYYREKNKWRIVSVSQCARARIPACCSFSCRQLRSRNTDLDNSWETEGGWMDGHERWVDGWLVHLARGGDDGRVHVGWRLASRRAPALLSLFVARPID